MITSRTRSLISLAGLAALLLPACGDDGDGAAGTPDTTDAAGDATLPPVDTTDAGTTPPPETTNVPSGIEHPTGADDVVVRIGYYGGFVPAEYAFRNLPVLLLSGDGRLLRGVVVPDIYPGPLVAGAIQRSVTEAGIQDLLALADEHGLLADHTYDRPMNIADAPDAVVEITAGGDTFFHSAYALGIGDETDDARTALAAFVDAATGGGVNDWGYADNPELGPDVPFVPETYLIRSMPAPAASGDIAPTLVDWPTNTSVRLADASDCAAVPAIEVDALFEHATQLTYFVEDGTTYQLSVKPQLPGDAC